MLLTDIVYNRCSFKAFPRQQSYLLDRRAGFRTRQDRLALGTVCLSRRSKLLQILHGYLLQRTLIRRMQEDLRHRLLADLSVLEPIQRFFPPSRTQTPLAAICQADGAEVIAFGGRIIEEVFGHHRGYGVVALVFCTSATVSVAVEASKWLFGEEGEGFLEDCRTLCQSSCMVHRFSRLGESGGGGKAYRSNSPYLAW